MNRGSAAAPGDEIFLIETMYPGYTKTKVFTSRAGFDAGLRAVKFDVDRRRGDPRVGGAHGYRTYRLPDPQWKEFQP